MVAPQMITPTGEIKAMEPSHPDVSNAPAPSALANPTLNSPDLQQPGSAPVTEQQQLKDGTKVITSSRVLD